MSRCHACARTIDEADAYASVSVAGEQFLFCCPMCTTAFEAAQVQRAFIPKPFTDTQFRLRVVYLPALHVGGDYGHVHRTGDERVEIVVGDISGHGVASSLVMSRLSAEVEACLERGGNITELAGALNEKIRVFGSPRQMYMTLFAASIDLTSRTLTYVSCGHPPQLLYSAAAGTYADLESLNVPVGLFPGPVFGKVESRQYEFGPGDRLCLFTDGLTDLQKEDGNEFGGEGARAAFAALCDDHDPQAEQHVYEHLNVLQNQQLQDDVLLLSLAALPARTAESNQARAS